MKEEVEADEVHINAGSKGNNGTRPEDRAPRRRGLKKGRGTYETDKTPASGLVECEGGTDLSVVKNAQTQTIQAIMGGVIAPNTTIYSDGYDIYNFVDRSPNYTRAQVCHSAGEYALDLDHDGIYETHVNTQDGAWSLLRPWIRPS